jgi:hypothetical protein
MNDTLPVANPVRRRLFIALLLLPLCDPGKYSDNTERGTPKTLWQMIQTWLDNLTGRGRTFSGTVRRQSHVSRSSY